MVAFRSTALIAALLLSACGREPAIPSAPEASPTLAAEVLSAFPADFRGRWGLVPADCEVGRSDAKGLMIVGVDNLKFYESRATLSGLRQTGPDALEAALSFSGEGMTWTKRDRFRLAADRQALERRTSDETGETRLRYTRCPA